MGSRAKFLVDKARENQNETPLSRTRPKNQIKNNLEENLFSGSGKTHFAVIILFIDQFIHINTIYKTNLILQRKCLITSKIVF